MINRVAEQLREITSWPRAAIMLIVTIILLVTYFQYIGPLEEYGGGAPHLDVRFGVGYSHADVLKYFDTLGVEGRAFYAKTTLFDTIWPLCIGVCGALWAPLAFHNNFWVVVAAASPVLFGILDLLENIGLWIMLSQYPEISQSVASVGNAITLVKQAMIPGWVLSIPGLPIIAIFRRLLG